jgi:sulfotransferase family protein
MSARPRLLYIAGLGRSGSTLLDLVLGELEGAHSSGELRRYWQAMAAAPGEEGSEWLCGCGEPVRSCSFWRQVGEASPLTDAPMSAAQAFAYQRRAVRLRPGPVRRLRKSVSDPERDGYADMASRLIGAVTSASGAELVVDSSKRPEEAYLLAENTDVDLRLVHLVRDPRAVAHSRSRVKRTRQGAGPGDYFQRWHPAATAARWAVRAEFVDRMLRPLLGSRCLLLRYEDFTRDPVGSIRRVAALAGLEQPEAPFASERTVTLGENHSLPGNPIRFTRGSLEIRADDAWRSEMPAGARRLVSALDFPWMRRYGY